MFDMPCKSQYTLIKQSNNLLKQSVFRLYSANWFHLVVPLSIPLTLQRNNPLWWVTYIVSPWLTIRICKKFQSRKVSQISKMTNHLQNFSSETVYVQDMSFVAKGFTMKLFLRIFLNSVIYKTFPIRNFLRIRYCYSDVFISSFRVTQVYQGDIYWRFTSNQCRVCAALINNI